MTLDAPSNLAFLSLIESRRIFRTAVTPASEPFRPEQPRAFGCSAAIVDPGKRHGRGRFRSGANAFGDKETRQQERHTHGGAGRVCVEFGGLGQALPMNARKDVGLPQRGVGLG